MSTPNILAKKSEEVPVPYCKTEAESEDNNRPGPLVSSPRSIRGYSLILWRKILPICMECLLTALFYSRITYWL
jgi:hypothetical protein